MIRSTIRKNILSKNWADFRANLAIAISKRKLSRRQIQKLYSLLRETKDGQFYSDNQSAYPINSNSADWNTEYMDELFAAVVNGYTNEKIVLHMCDVSNKLKWRDKRYIVKVVLTALGVIVGIVVSIVCIHHFSKTKTNVHLKNNQESVVLIAEQTNIHPIDVTSYCSDEAKENTVCARMENIEKKGELL